MDGTAKRRQIAGCILAGGQNRRMRGEKKLFLEYGGEGFYRRILRAMGQFSAVYLSVEDAAPYGELGLPLIVDRYGPVGPAGAILSVLTVCEAEAVLVAACDMPFIDEDAVERLLCEYERFPGIVAAQSGGRVQPLLGIYPQSAAPVLERAVRQGDYRMMKVLEQAGYRAVPLPEGSRAAENINTPEDYRRLREMEITGKTNSGKSGRGIV